MRMCHIRALNGSTDRTRFRNQQAGGSAFLREDMYGVPMIKASSSQLPRPTREMAIVALVGTDLRARSAIHDLSFLRRKTVLSLSRAVRTHAKGTSGEGSIDFG